MLRIIGPTLKRGLFVGAVVILAGGLLPLPAFADSSSSQTCTPPPATQPGVTRPIGADANTYTYDCTTGLWENGYYSYNPATGVYAPTYPIVYTYDPTTGLYDTTVWVYNAPSKQYVATTQSVSTPPSGAAIVGGPAPVVSTPSGSSISGTGPDSNNNIDTDNGTDSGTISNTGPDSDNSIGGSGSNDLTSNNTNNATVSNLLGQSATTGDASVLANTSGGNATTGDAQDMTNLVNMLQSSSNALGGNTVTFVANIDGNVNGDLLFDPSTLGTVQPASSTATAGNNNLTINNQTNAAINNNVNLDSNSGNATVADNTTAGNATSGSAQAIANVVNLIDSAISSGNSFVGVININGDLNGNIVVPPDLINQLIASNVPTVSISDTGPSSNNTINGGTSGNTTTVNNTNNQGINNTVTSSANSGQASVSGNTSAGNATSGNAASNITAFNLTGSNVIGSNDLLVFVNVLGSWVGMIIGAPAGATAAEFGGGVTSDSSGNNTTTVNNANNEQINNNINATAQSGNATVADNTTGGNATSGNADTAVNLLNVEGTTISLSNWFGILFINVFGTWTGNFGVEPSPGDNISTISGTTTTGAGAATKAVAAEARIFRLVSNGNGGFKPVAGNGSTSNIPTDTASVLAAHFKKTTAPTPQLQTAGHRSFLLPIIGIILFVLFFTVSDRFFARRDAKTEANV